MFNKIKGVVSEKVIGTVRSAMSDDKGDITSTVVTLGIIVLATGAIFGAGMRIIPSRTNLHVYIHVK